ncbi:MAG: phage terminase small subunit P27 family [Acidobacteriota bacterium]|nr:phage terminase small subunit P27 family [Acidobacteriota bacterium]
MAQRAKSLLEHALHGTVPAAKNPALQSGIASGRPKFPRDLSASLRSVFKATCKLLETRRALTEADGPLLALYCKAFARAQRANAKLEEEGEITTYTRLDSNGQAHEFKKPNLWLKVAQDAERQMVACLDRLGMSPLNRDKVKPTKVSDEEKPLDPMEQFLNRAPKVLQFNPERNRDERIAREEAKEKALREDVPGKGVAEDGSSI